MGEDRRQTWPLAEQLLGWIADNEGAHQLELNDYAEANGLKPRAVHREAERLRNSGYFDAVIGVSGPRRAIMRPVLTERGLRQTGIWPAEGAAEELLRVLDAQIAEANGDERSRLERLRSAAGEVSKNVLSQTIAAVARSQMGL